MPKKLKIDTDKLVEAVEKGVTSKQIMQDFGLRTLVQLKALYLDALMEKGKAHKIVRERNVAADKRSNKETKVNKRGSLVIPKEFVEEAGFKVGDSFTLRKSAAGISLKKI